MIKGGLILRMKNVMAENSSIIKQITGSSDNPLFSNAIWGKIRMQAAIQSVPI